MRRRAGFTLIELMIVVVIIGVLSAVAIPMIARRLSDASNIADKRQQAAIAQSKAAQEAPPVEVDQLITRRSTRNAAPTPRLIALDGRIDIKAGHRLDGLNVHTWYEAQLEGAYTFQPADPQARAHLAFPFPVGSVGASDVMLRLRQPDGALAEPEGVVYDLRGIYWEGRPPTAIIEAQVTYRAEGYDRFLFHLPGEGRTPSLRLKLHIEGVEAPRIPAAALQPTTQAPGDFSWRFDNLVTDTREIRVELPAVLSPIGRVILLAKLASVGVLLFGLGFWFISEGREPGRLDAFRWGHFLLLSLTYFLFFVIFAVLMFRYQLSAPLGLAVSAGLSLPLLILHVAFNLGGRLGWGFALGRVLPLASFTLLLVINGVYGGALREYIYLGALVFALAYLTLSYRGWTAGRQAHRAARGWAARRAGQDKEARGRLEELRRVTHNARALLRQIEETLSAPDTPDLEPQRAASRAASAALTAAMSPCDLDALEAEIQGLSALAEAEDKHTEAAVSLAQTLQGLRAAIAPAHEQAEEARARLVEARAAGLKARRRARGERERLISARIEALSEAVAWAGRVDMAAEAALYGGVAPSLAAAATALEARRAALAEALTEEVGFLERRRALSAETDDEAHAATTVRLERDLLRFEQRLRIIGEVLAGESEGLAAARRQGQARGLALTHQRHCGACGAVMGDGAAYCGACGAHQPELTCAACEAKHTLPMHLIGLWPPAAPPRCPACGAAHEGALKA